MEGMFSKARLESGISAHVMPELKRTRCPGKAPLMFSPCQTDLQPAGNGDGEVALVGPGRASVPRPCNDRCLPSSNGPNGALKCAQGKRV